MATITAQTTKTKTTPRMVRGAAGLPRLARRFAACASRGAALPPSRALGRTKSRDLDATRAISLDRDGSRERRRGHGKAMDMVPLGSAVAAVQQGLADRVAADEEFLFKLIWEVLQDQVIIVLTVVASCGLPSFWTTEQMANACLLHATAFFNDILLMWFLAATKSPHSSGAGRGGKKKKGLSHMFEPSATATIGDRAKCWVDKFLLYAPLGLATALLSSVVMGRFLGPEASNPLYLCKVGLVGLIHLGVSSNTRYQMINGADVLYYRVLDKKAARSATIASRLVNQVAGGKLFLLLSALIL